MVDKASRSQEVWRQLTEQASLDFWLVFAFISLLFFLALFCFLCLALLFICFWFMFDVFVSAIGVFYVVALFCLMLFSSFFLPAVLLACFVPLLVGCLDCFSGCFV